ncbi:LysR family transcriptional regulator [Roseibium sp.]|uniref:LysR family transcriptional regulator n=1 Tax=Roseibium sp. TaxID=1936156 RepID=UPI003BB0F5AE
MYNIADLQSFVALAKSGGITSAAAQQGISAATASHRLAKLESSLNVTLVHRNSRSFRLTEEGQLFLERVETILEELQQAELEIGSGTAQLRGHLRVTMSPWILSRFVMPVLPEFRRQHPDLSVEFLAVDRYVPLVEEAQDCAIRVGQLADSSLIAAKLCDNHRIICAAPRFLEEQGRPELIEDLRDAPWVCLPWQTRFDLVDRKGRKRQISVARSVAVSNSDMLTAGAIEGLGFAVKSRLAVQDELDAGALVEVMPGRLHAPEAPISFVYSAETRSSSKTRAFLDLARVAFRR